MMERFSPAYLKKVGPRRWLASAAVVAVAVPALFYLNFGAIGAIGLGTTVFLTVFCVLAAVGSGLADRTEYHTPVAAHGDWLDRIGAFWLVACAFGPLFGWLATAGVFPLTESNWRWRFAARVALAIVAPVVTALPLTRYARGRSALVAVPLLVCVTALPVLSGSWTARDLVDGPVTQRAEVVWSIDHGKTLRAVDGPPFDADAGDADVGYDGDVCDVTYLRHTGRIIAVAHVK
jgi:hypothetical protein